MNTSKIITLVVLLAITLILAGCSESITVRPESRIVDPAGIEISSIVTLAQLQSPWWESGYVDSNWTY